MRYASATSRRYDAVVFDLGGVVLTGPKVCMARGKLGDGVLHGDIDILRRDGV